MTCTRCEGLMVSDDLIDLQESYHPMWSHGYRCLCCGNVVDTVIQKNRMIQQSSLRRIFTPAPEKPRLFELVRLSA
ncbi:MAG: hypothetical protein KF814_04320 [Nitrospiraceae bacterium]|nr:hypothetical protein [Nitrospiraceae bacterium]